MGASKSKDLDQFYTKPDVARKCLSLLLENIAPMNLDSIQFLEPSAGTGAFLSLLPKGEGRHKGQAFPFSVGVDVDPKAPGIIKGDLLESTALNLRLIDKGNVVTIGNPPFGRNASVAVLFFNRCAEMSSTIAFIVPKTFRKASLQNRLDRGFTLVVDVDIQSKSFLFNGKEYDVPCCFQIWKKSTKTRQLKNTKRSHDWFDFTSPEEADFAIRRVGWRAGAIETTALMKLSVQNTYFIKVKNPALLSVLQKVDFSVIRTQTAGVRSVSKGELVSLLDREIERQAAKTAA